MTKQDLIDFEKMIADRWDRGLIKYPVHLSGGNEDELIQIFQNIHKDDWVFSMHRSHYHYLLKANKTFNDVLGVYTRLDRMIMQGRSMHIMDKSINFFATGIVAGACAIAVGVAKAIKNNNRYWEYATHERGADDRHVYCFIGDGATDEGHYWEALKYSIHQELSITFIIEDNNRSVCSTKEQRYGRNEPTFVGRCEPKCIIYRYTSTYPHVGTGKTIKFADMGEVKETL